MIKEKSENWNKLMVWFGRTLSPLPISPDYYSWLTLVPAVLGFIALVNGALFWGLVLFMLSGTLDLADGAVARHRGEMTKAGAFLDGTLDRFVDFLLIFAYLWMPIHTPGLALSHWVALAVFLSLMPTFEVAYANHRGAVDDPNETIIWRILHRGEMFALMLLIIIFAMFSASWAGYLLIALVVLCAITTVQTIATTLYLSGKTDQ